MVKKCEICEKNLKQIQKVEYIAMSVVVNQQELIMKQENIKKLFLEKI